MILTEENQDERQLFYTFDQVHGCIDNEVLHMHYTSGGIIDGIGIERHEMKECK
jgi:hypothetical protein